MGEVRTVARNPRRVMRHVPMTGGACRPKKRRELSACKRERRGGDGSYVELTIGGVFRDMSVRLVGRRTLRSCAWQRWRRRSGAAFRRRGSGRSAN